MGKFEFNCKNTYIVQGMLINFKRLFDAQTCITPTPIHLSKKKKKSITLTPNSSKI